MGHGLSKHPLYKSWNNMTQRVGKHKNYLNISVCDEWRNSFVTFYEWSISNGWQKGLELDRIDNKGNYEPNNCRWTTRYVQVRNMSRNRFYKYKDDYICIQDLCEKYNLNRNTFNKRFSLGWSIKEIIETPILDARSRMIGTKLSQETKDKIRKKLIGNNNRIKNIKK